VTPSKAHAFLILWIDRRKLDSTIIWSGGLGRKPGNGTVSAGEVQLAKVIKREDLACVIVQCMGEAGTIGLAFGVVARNTQPLKQSPKSRWGELMSLVAFTKERKVPFVLNSKSVSSHRPICSDQTRYLKVHYINNW
jgi:hypothetical protein